MPQRFQQQYRGNTASTRKFSPHRFSSIEGRSAGKAFVYFPKQFTRKNNQLHKIYRKTPLKPKPKTKSKSKSKSKSTSNQRRKSKNNNNKTKGKKSRTIQ